MSELKSLVGAVAGGIAFMMVVGGLVFPAFFGLNGGLTGFWTFCAVTGTLGGISFWGLR